MIPPLILIIFGATFASLGTYNIIHPLDSDHPLVALAWVALVFVGVVLFFAGLTLEGLV